MVISQKEQHKAGVDRKQEINDREIIRQCRRGDVESFGKIVEKYQKMIYNIILRMVHDSADADDITQAAFVKAYEKLDQYKTEYPFFSWIHRIAVNEALNFIKQQKRIVGIEDTHETDENNPEEEYARNELQERVDRALEELTPEYRIIIVLRHFGELSYREISEILGVPEKTVKSRLFTARQELRVILM